MNYCVLKTKGKIYRIPKAPFETEEQAMDRVWFISTQTDEPIQLSKSLMWVYQKYLNVKY